MDLGRRRGSLRYQREEVVMTENQGAGRAGEPELVETGNFPDPWDGPQDHLEQTTEPQFDEDLVDAADDEVEEP